MFYCRCWIILIAVIFVKESVSVQSVTSRDTNRGLPCAGLKHELIRHDDVVVCSSTWTGDINNADNICQNVWHVCTWDDVNVLQKISWYEATHISGCYAINAAHNDETCSQCEGKIADSEMAAIGADCVGYNKSSSSCFGGGRIDASLTRIRQYTPCHHAPWITGVLCCRDKAKERAPEVFVHPEENTEVFESSEIRMNCKAIGEPKPTFKWFKNGFPVSNSGRYEEDTANGMLVIPSASTEDNGYWQCLAINRLGVSLSNGSHLNVREFGRSNKAAIGCKNPRNGKMLESANIAVCDGMWSGHVRKATKQICARGWRVCSVEDMHTLNSVKWQEVKNINGCYAYNAASSKFYPCTKCKRKNAGSRMSGIGALCSNIQENGYSCLERGRMDVLSYSAPPISSSNKTLRSCSHVEGVTTGVACCRKSPRNPRSKSANVASCPCKNGGRCKPGRSSCVCKSGYRGKFCQLVRKRYLKRIRNQARRRERRVKCGKTRCSNHGVCYKGRCVCRQHFQGDSCKMATQFV